MRHHFFQFLIAPLFFGAVVLFLGSTCYSQTFDLSKFKPEKFNPAKFKEYEQQLNAILKTRRDEEKKFINEIVQQVRKGKIPSKLVATSFQWVRNKRPNTDHPFVYFEQVIRLQARKLNIAAAIPPFDYSIYQTRANRYGTIKR